MNTELLFNEGIAIIGMSCRFPQAPNLATYWDNLCAGRVALSLHAQSHPLGDIVPNFVPASYKVADIDCFDAAYFGYAGSDAERIDPQQRFFLECSCHALEDAGYPPRGQAKETIGVFAGVRMSTYLSKVYAPNIPEGPSHAFHCLIGNDKDYLASRVAYKLNLHGPAVSVQTACSSALTSVHLACEALRNESCDMALAGAVALDIPHDPTNPGYIYQEGMIFSHDGYCRPFDAKASGTVFSGGCGVVLLKRYKDAVKDHDPIYAVLLGSAINNDGAERVGFTAPGELGQTQVIAQALAEADISAREIGYVETHGTGTQLGDPIEFSALCTVFRNDTEDKQFCALGAVKANIGHADAAAGIASVIKACMAVHTGVLPPHPLFSSPNPEIHLNDSPFYINTDLRPWEGPRIAGVSSFGIGGSNGHIVLAEPPKKPAVHKSEPPTQELFVLSAKNEDALKAYAERMARAIETEPTLTLRDICATCMLSRSDDPVRIALFCRTKEDLAAQLRKKDTFATSSVPASKELADAREAYLAGRPNALDDLKKAALEHGCARVHLPGYPFAKTSFWPKREKKPLPAHPVWTEQHAFANTSLYLGSIRPETLLRLREHRVFDTPIAPGALILELLHAALVFEHAKPMSLCDVRILSPLQLKDTQEIPVALTISSDRSCALYAQGSDWIEIAQAHYDEGTLTDEPIPESQGTELPPNEYYARLRTLGIDYGPAFQGITRIQRSDGPEGTAYGKATSLVRGARHGFAWDPCVLDSCLQGVLALAPQGAENAELSIPAAFGRVTLAPCAKGALSVRTEVHEPPKKPGDDFTVTVTIWDSERCIGRIQAMRLHPAKQDESSLTYSLDWTEIALTESSDVPHAANFVTLRQTALTEQLGAAPISENDIPEDAHILFDTEGLEAKSALMDLLTLAKKLAATKQNRLTVITHNAIGPRSRIVPPGQGMLIGLARVIMTELPNLSTNILDTDAGTDDKDTLRTLITSSAPDTHDTYVLREGTVFVPNLTRHTLAKETFPTVYALESTGTGLDALTPKPVAPIPPKAHEIQVRVQAASLNFRDVMMAMGIYPGKETAIGSDAAGLVTAVGPEVTDFQINDRVAVSAYGCMRTHITVQAAMAAKIPDSITFEDAAALPVAYITAWYALIEEGGLASGQDVLIHAASGGVGLAALALCGKVGARVYATAGSPEKRAYVERKAKEFGTNLAGIYDSRSAGFSSALRESGVDLVLNSLAGPLQDLSFDLVRPGGVYLELGKSNVKPCGTLENAQGTIRYRPIDLVVLGESEPEKMSAIFRLVMAKVAEGELPHLPTTTFAHTSFREAFRTMAQTRHIGKLVLRFSPETQKSGTEILTGGLGDLGLRLAEHRARAGVRHLVLIGRRAPSPEACARISAIEDLGATVRTILASVADKDALEHALDEALADCPKPSCIFHLAGCLDDAAIQNQTEESFAKVLAPKVLGARNLHSYLVQRGLSSCNLILFSSTTALLGANGLANYAAANSFLQEFVTYRRALGLPCQCLSFGAFAEIGMAARSGNQAVFDRFGLHTITPEEGFRACDALLAHQEEKHLIVTRMNWQKYATLGHIPGLCRALCAKTQEKKERSTSEPLEEIIAEKVADILRIDKDTLDRTANLLELGLDSLLALDLFQYLEKTTGLTVKHSLLFENPSIAALTAALTNSQSTKEDLPQITPDPDHAYDPFPLMSMQNAYWVGRTRAVVLGNVSCHVYLELESKNLNIPAFEHAWQKTIERHDMLRAIILESGEQRILPKVPDFVIQIHENADRLAIREEMSHEVRTAKEWPLFAVAITKSHDCTVIHISLDLLLADLHSMNLIMNDLAFFYEHPDGQKKAIELRFRDYVCALDAVAKTPRYQADKAYWEKRLADLPEAPDLPLAKAPEAIAKPRFVRHKARLDAWTWKRLKDLAKEHDLTASGLLLACYAEVLARWSARKDFTINVTLFNRLPLHKEVDAIVGDFTSVSLLAYKGENTTSFLDRAQNVQKTLWQDMDHSLYPGVSVIRDWSKATGLAASKIIPIVFTSTLGFGDDHTTHPALHTFGSLAYSITQTPQVWIDHQVREDDDCLDFNWDSIDELFPQGMVSAMFTSYTRLLHQLAHNTQLWHRTALPLLPESQVLVRTKVNATERDYSAYPKTLDGFFARSLARVPKRRALAMPSATKSYEEVGRAVWALMEKIRPHVHEGDLVAVLSSGSWQDIVAALAITSLGCAYVPLDGKTPVKRLEQVLDHAKVSLLLGTTLPDALPKTIPWLDIESDLWTATQDYRPRAEAAHDSLAYVIHTSGSTGAPKGVLITHKSCANTLAAIEELLTITEEDSVLALSSFTFDLSVFDIFGVLGAGGTVVLPDPTKRLEAEHWIECMENYGVTLWNTVPPFFQMLTDTLEHRGSSPHLSLRAALLSGDWIPVTLPKRIRRFLPDIALYGLGGATEASIWSNVYPIYDVDPSWRSIPYGVPLPNQRFTVLDVSGNSCPDYVPGELYIEGQGLALGYLNDNERTFAQFVHNPETGERAYATGDLGRYLPDGTLEFLGRADNQVKINGFRVELGEIEHTVLQNPAVKAAVALAFDGQGQGKILALFVEPNRGQSVSEEEIRAYLTERLPPYLIPKRIECLDHFPLRPTGKIDRAQLTLDLSVIPNDTLAKPTTATEEQITKVIARVLKTEAIGIDTRFFEMGISSLDLVAIHAQLQEELQITFPLMTLLEHTCIRALAAQIQTMQKKRTEQSSSQPSSFSRGMRRAEMRAQRGQKRR